MSTSLVTDRPAVTWAAPTSADARSAALALLTVDAALGCVFLVVGIIGYQPAVLGLDVEGSVPTWYSATQLFVLAQALGLLGCVTWRRDWRSGVLFLVSGLIALGLSIDEVAQFHERYGRFVEPLLLGEQREEMEFDVTGYWMLALGPPLAAVLAVGLWLVGRWVRVSRGVAIKGIGGVALFLTSATGVEALSNFFPSGLAGQRPLTRGP